MRNFLTLSWKKKKVPKIPDIIIKINYDFSKYMKSHLIKVTGFLQIHKYIHQNKW